MSQLIVQVNTHRGLAPERFRVQKRVLAIASDVGRFLAAPIRTEWNKIAPEGHWILQRRRVYLPQGSVCKPFRQLALL